MKKFHFWHDFIPHFKGFNILHVLEREVPGIFCVTSRLDMVLLLADFAWNRVSSSYREAGSISSQD